MTIIDAVLPAATVNGVAAPTLKPSPETLTEETATLAFPVLERVTFWLLLAPTVTFPKARELGETLRIPTGVFTPVPDNATTLGDPERLLLMDADPVTFPTLVGANTTFAV